MVRASANICYFTFSSQPSPSDLDRIASVSERFIIFDSSAAVSEFHVIAALREAESVYSHVKKYRRVGTLFLMFLTGNAQIESALRKARITSESRTFISIILGKQKCEDVLELLPRSVVLSDRSIPYDIPDKDRTIFNAMTMVSLKL